MPHRSISASHAAFALRLPATALGPLIFEATFAFTVVTARWLVESPKETLFDQLQSRSPARLLFRTTGSWLPRQVISC